MTMISLVYIVEVVYTLRALRKVGWDVRNVTLWWDFVTLKFGAKKKKWEYVR